MSFATHGSDILVLQLLCVWNNLVDSSQQSKHEIGEVRGEAKNTVIRGIVTSYYNDN